MHDVLIIKLGSASEELKTRRGDFEQWFARGLGMTMDQCLVVNPETGDALPDPRTYRGMVLTGSDAMLTDNPDWSLRTQQWLVSALERDIPVLGVCYGHHLLAQTLGGEVGWSANGEEIGTVTIELTPEGHKDPLLARLPGTLTVQSSHSQAVLALPPGARLLARNAHEPIQGFAFGSNIWGFQFHPEFDADVSSAYIEEDREKLKQQGRDPEILSRAARDSDHGTVLLRRFAQRLR
jgi:GMP synthase (glutamine-hydrolysing)